jgi:hypothetical protein
MVMVVNWHVTIQLCVQAENLHSNVLFHSVNRDREWCPVLCCKQESDRGKQFGNGVSQKCGCWMEGSIDAQYAYHKFWQPSCVLVPLMVHTHAGQNCKGCNRVRCVD